MRHYVLESVNSAGGGAVRVQWALHPCERIPMATLTEDMKQFINDNLAFVATVSADGVPDLGPKMSMFALDDNHLA